MSLNLSNRCLIYLSWHTKVISGNDFWFLSIHIHTIGYLHGLVKISFFLRLCVIISGQISSVLCWHCRQAQFSLIWEQLSCLRMQGLESILGCRVRELPCWDFFLFFSHCHWKEGFHVQQFYLEGFIQKLHQWTTADSITLDVYWRIHTKTPWTVLVHSPVLYHSISACQVSMHQHLEYVSNMVLYPH